MNTLIAITGPESTGKTDLAEALSAAYPRSLVVPEHARAYPTSLAPGYRYHLDDILHIAVRQRHDIGWAARHNGPVFCDSDDLVLYIWIREVFGTTNTPVADWIAEQSFRHTLLCAPDIPWEPDPLRENPHDRDRLFAIYKEELERLERPYSIIQGSGPERLSCAMQALAGLI